MDAIVYDKIGKEAQKLKDMLLGLYPQESIDNAPVAIASFDDGADSIPVKKLVANIEPVQTGSGDPSPDNVRPISGWTGAKINRAGNNLLSLKCYAGGEYNPPVGSVWNLQEHTKQFTPDGNKFAITLENQWTSLTLITPVKDGLLYSINIGITSTEMNGVSVGFLDKDFTVLSKSNGTDVTQIHSTLNPGVDIKNCAYSYIVITNRLTVNSTITLTEPQLVIGSTTTTYEPYTGNQIFVNWETEAGTVYGGTLDMKNGVLTVTMLSRDLGALNWTYNGNYGSATNVFKTYIDSCENVSSSQTANALCSNYKCVSNDALYAGRNNSLSLYKSVSDIYATIRINDTAYSDATSFKTAMNGVMLVYKIASSQTYQLTPEQIDTLLGTNNIWADTGDVTKLTYRADLGMYINKAITASAANVLNS